MFATLFSKISMDGLSKDGLGGLLPKHNFQSGFGNTNDIADSLGSLIGLGPRPRKLVLNSTNQIHVIPMQNKIDSDTESMTPANSGQVLTELDKFMSLFLTQRKSERWKSSNTKAAQQQDIRDYTKLRTDFRNRWKPFFNVKSTQQHVSDVQFNDIPMSHSVRFNQYSLKAETLNKLKKEQKNKVIRDNSNVSAQIIADDELNNDNNQPKKDNTMAIIIAVLSFLLLFGKKLFK